ncbi:hypothetical protein [Arthrobacter sp. ISL-5]|uniref:hypothetical protein n=1 Tax=Arthrobacter sp. ISL-5 TaxID=2819111 RepID=UPI001BE5A719|nr:hypothetical protein [Arthrobacter sp. ISL-5]MBT2555921.1 hypothetical protein [Arthrobacter sp. ISL-5]
MKQPNTPASVWSVRIVLGLAGTALIGYGLLGLPTQLGPAQLLGLLTWMAFAILLHDGVIVPLLTLTGAGLTRTGSRLGPVSAAILRGALMTGAAVSLIAGLLLKAQSEARNISALEGNYAEHLLWFWAALAAAAAVAIYAFERAGRPRPPTGARPPGRAGSGKGERRQNTRP